MRVESIILYRDIPLNSYCTSVRPVVEHPCKQSSQSDCTYPLQPYQKYIRYLLCTIYSVKTSSTCGVDLPLYLLSFLRSFTAKIAMMTRSPITINISKPSSAPNAEMWSIGEHIRHVPLYIIFYSFLILLLLILKVQYTV